MAPVGKPWQTFDCPDTERHWRVIADGRIEIEDLGTPVRTWPTEVNNWAQLIAVKAQKYQVPAYWIAAIMALETGGRPGLCIRKSDGSCSTREGIGLMAMLQSTATAYAGRTVGINELLDDHDLQIDLGAKMIANLGEKYGGDYVKMAIGYNAGAIHCGAGSTWNLPKEPCPPTPWGVRMGCLRTAKAINSYCAPSVIDPSKFACPVNYPEVAIGTYNAALQEGWTNVGLSGRPPPFPNMPPPEPLPVATPPAEAGLGVAGLVPLAAAAIVGYYGYALVVGGLKTYTR